jgi:hypothetical protein
LAQLTANPLVVKKNSMVTVTFEFLLTEEMARRVLAKQKKNADRKLASDNSIDITVRLS